MTNIDCRSRRLTALGILASTGMRKSYYAPLLHRLFWRFGVEVKPPHFAGFFQNLSLGGVWAGGMCLYLLLCGCPIGRAVLASSGAGLLLGVFAGIHFWRERRRHSLPSWTELPGAVGSSHPTEA